MNNIWLDFERPIQELVKKIDELRGMPGVEDELERLQTQAERVKKKVYSNLTRWQRVQLARHPKRPYSLDYIKLIIEDFVELHGDRRFSDDWAIVAGIGRFNKTSVAIVAEQKGRDMKEKLKRNFGMPHPDGYRKALRVMKLAAKFNMPVISFVDTPGAYPGVGAEERGQAEAIAVNLFECSALPVPIQVVIIGEGSSGGALGIAVGDRIMMLENAYYSVISPEGCASILYRDSSRNKDAAEALRISARDLQGLGVIDEIISEPLGGAHLDYEMTATNIKKALIRNFDELLKLPVKDLLTQRVEKFRKMGVYKE